jgi:pyruvate dehydrogenase E1 component alpha subunit
METNDISVAVFGDGSSNIGAFHEGLNLAAIWNLPVVFICENNQYGEYSKINKTTPITDIAKRADSYGMPGLVVDGQDLDEVVDAVTEAASAARTGSGPSLLEMKTYRYAGHSRADTAPYRPEGEFEDWYERDPINSFRELLIGEGSLSEETNAKILASVAERIENAVTTVRNSPVPGIQAMFANINA